MTDSARSEPGVKHFAVIDGQRIHFDDPQEAYRFANDWDAETWGSDFNAR